MKSKLAKMTIDAKQTYSIAVLREARMRYGDDVGVIFSGGKDSTAMLHLVRRAFDDHIPWKVFTTSTGMEFPAMKDFIRRMDDEWGLSLITLRNEENLERMNLEDFDRTKCCLHLKDIPINVSIVRNGLKALLSAVKWDDDEYLSGLDFFSWRDGPAHVRIQPILHFGESDIWTYIKDHSIPYCDLYEKGYRTINCTPCTSATVSGAPAGEERTEEERCP